MSVKVTKSQRAALENAKAMHKQGLYYCPESVAAHSAARAQVRRGLLFIKRGVRHQVTGYGVVGQTYPSETPVIEPVEAGFCGAVHKSGTLCTMWRGHATAYHTATGFDMRPLAQWYDDGRDL